MDLKIQDLVMHTSVVKEMWDYLEKLYLGKNNLNRVFDIIQKMFKSKKGNKTLSHHCLTTMQTLTWFIRS